MSLNACTNVPSIADHRHPTLLGAACWLRLNTRWVLLADVGAWALTSLFNRQWLCFSRPCHSSPSFITPAEWHPELYVSLGMLEIVMTDSVRWQFSADGCTCGIRLSWSSCDFMIAGLGFLHIFPYFPFTRRPRRHLHLCLTSGPSNYLIIILFAVLKTHYAGSAGNFGCWHEWSTKELVHKWALSTVGLTHD